MAASRDVDLDTLLANAGWLRQLARCLASDQVEVDDLVQETWLAALRSPPTPGRPPRPWLAEVARNLVRMGWRTASRRPTRVPRDLDLVSDESANADEVLERLQLQRALAALVCELDEPFRTTITLRFYEGLATAAIAARLDVPPGTVRWRLAEGVRRLRAHLDEHPAGRQGRWRLMVLGAPGEKPVRAAAGPVPAVAATSAGLLAVAAALVWLAPGAAGDRPAGPVAVQAPPPPGRRAAPPSSPHAARLAGLFGVALPALVAAADDDRPHTRDEMIADCLWHGTRTVECRDSAVDVMVGNFLDQWAKENGPGAPPPEEVAAFRKKRLDGVLLFAGESPEDQRRRCARNVDEAQAKGRDWSLPRSKDALWHACFDGQECDAASRCVDRLLRRWKAEKQGEIEK